MPSGSRAASAPSRARGGARARVDPPWRVALAARRPIGFEVIFEAGADVVETNSFQASRTRLEEWGLGERTVELNRAAAATARRVADRHAAADVRPRFVAGSMGPSGFLPSSEDPELGRLSQADL